MQLPEFNRTNLCKRKKGARQLAKEKEELRLLRRGATRRRALRTQAVTNRGTCRAATLPWLSECWNITTCWPKDWVWLRSRPIFARTRIGYAVGGSHLGLFDRRACQRPGSITSGSMVGFWGAMARKASSKREDSNSTRSLGSRDHFYRGQ